MQFWTDFRRFWFIGPVETVPFQWAHSQTYVLQIHRDRSISLWIKAQKSSKSHLEGSVLIALGPEGPQ